VHDVSLKSEDVKISEGKGSQRGSVDKDGEEIHRSGAALFEGFLRGFVGVAVHGLSPLVKVERGKISRAVFIGEFDGAYDTYRAGISGGAGVPKIGG